MEEGKKKKGFLKKIEKSRWKQGVFSGICMLTLFAIYLPWKQAAEHRVTVISDDFSWVYQIDCMENREGQLKITGWAFALNKDAGENNFEIVLHSLETEKNIYPKISYEAREDVNEYFLCEYDYTQSGFTAVISQKKLKDRVYEVLLKTGDGKNAYSTNIYYVDGAMTFVNPEEFTPLDVAGTDLEPIVEQGILRVYRPDYGMYVYQYEGELYWIAEEWYDFIEGNTYVQYHMNTTQIANLPQSRLDNGYYWSNLGFRFMTRELTEWDTGSYRVAKYALPTEYSLTKIWTGNHTDGVPEVYKDNYTPGWIWKEEFRPWYEFN